MPMYSNDYSEKEEAAGKMEEHAASSSKERLLASMLLLLRPPVLCPSIDIFLNKGGQLPTSTDSQPRSLQD